MEVAVRVRMVVKVSGSRDGARWPAPGGELNVGAVEGAELVASGLAVEVGGGSAGDVVTAEAPVEVETAAVKRPRRRKAAG